MLLTKIKWMAIGVAVMASTVFIYNHRDAFKSNSSNNGVYKKINPEFASYISAFTTGYVSSGTTIKVKLSNEFGGTMQLNTPVKEKYFSFEPSIEGETVWKDGQTLEFKPKERLKPGQVYKATFHLSALVEVKKELQDFEFQFETVKQSVQLQVNDLKTYNSNDFNYYSVTGNVTTADFADAETVEKLLVSKLGNTTLKPKWQHNEKGTEHKFLLDSIQRPNSGYTNLTFNCDAKELGVEVKLDKSFEVPKKGEFKLLDTRLINDNEQYVLLNYSNPVDANQSLEGLIDLGGFKDLKFIVSNNQVLIYPNEFKTGSYTLKIQAGIRDTKGTRLEKSSEHNIVFTEVKPAVKFLGEGNILPSSNNLSIPFECVNLRAVDVKIVKIYENNVLQFLQNNSLDGGNNLAQVGKKIVEKRINLGITNPADYSVWKKFSLDISTLIKSEPGAIYRVFLSFKKSYSTYSCLGNTDDGKFEMEEIKEPTDEEDVSFYGYYYEDYYYSGYEYEEGEDYNWSDRDNPCKGAYYRQYERTVARNILASDLGITLKKGNDGSLFVVANDLLTTNPVGDVTIEVYDYQKQLIQSDKTNGEGQLFMNLKQKAYFLVAKKDNQRAYLRLDDGATLPLSLYDVSGEAIKKGIKGFIYGERGVWRPGDSLFLNFILEDKLGNIPVNHPVVFELTNPQGQVSKRLFSNKSVDGFYNFSTVTDKNAPTGLWNAEVKIGSIKFNKSIRIETIMPNRLKLQVDAGDNKLLCASDKNMLSVHANWLTGAVVHNLPVNVQVSLSSDNTSFPKFKDYVFDDATVHYEAQNITVLDDKLDDVGNISLPLNIDVQNNAPGFLKANFTTRVYEQGGAFSVDRFSIPYSPYTYYTGLKLPDGEKNTGILYTGKDHYIQIATCDFKGIATSRGNLKFEMYKLSWRWWWDQYADDVANYASDEYHESVQSEIVSSVNGKAKVKVNVKESKWGRYLIKVTDADGHSASMVTYFDWPNWMERDGGSDNKIVTNMLNFTTDKTSYKTKDEVTVTIPTPEKCRALVTIENGSRVIQADWIQTEKGTTKYKFKVKPEMAPNVYVHVSLLQPHSRANDLPIRLYGVVPITIDDPETHLKPVIEMPNELVPEQEVTIKVSEANDKEMAFTLAVVDEGLLDITRFKTPNPWNTFYSKEALGVKTWDVYDNVIGAFGAELERILSIGGDGSEVGDDGAKANRFKPMVRFFGPFHVDKGDKHTIKFKMPMYVGSVRTMVIAGEKGAYGSAEKTTPVKAPLMVLGTLPRVLSVTEEVKLPISVFGGSKAVGSTQIKVEVNEFLQTVGGNVRTVNIGKDDEKLVSFDLKVKNKTGIAKVKITATGGGHTANYELELDVRNPNPYQTTIKDFWVDAGKSVGENINAVGLAGTNSGVLELSTIPPINLEERLQYLITYPHGCIEQTTSQTFAQLYLTDILDLNPERKTAVENNIKYGINEIRKFQLQNGAMAYWQGLTEPNDWGTTYAGHFLILAEKKGYTLPAGMKKDWVSYQQTVAQNFEISKNKYYTNDMSQAYRLYVLALANQPATSAMNRLREYGGLTNEARWLLASAYAQVGQIDEAEKLIAKASTDVASYRVNYWTYGSSDRDMAIILDALCNMNKKQQAFTQLKKVSAILSSKSWLSTQTTAFGLVSVANFIKKFGGASAMQADVTLNGNPVNIKGNTAIVQIPIDFKSGKGGNFKIVNKGKGMLYARLVNRGKPPIGDEVAANENISVNAVYKDLNGNVISVDELGQSSNFMLSVTVTNLGLVGEVKNLALMNYIPSGWEIHNARMDENEAALKNSDFTYQDIKDDRVMTYFDLNQNQSKTFNIMLNASYEGKYYLPAVNVEAMYDNSIFARTKGQWIKVVKQVDEKVAGK